MKTDTQLKRRRSAAGFKPDATIGPARQGRRAGPLLKGGQGRTPGELEEVAGEFGVLAGVTLTGLLVWLVTIAREWF